MPDPAVCAQRVGLPHGADLSTPARAGATLLAHAREDIGGGRFDRAEQVLDCAEASAGAAADAQLRYELVRQRGVLAYRRELIPEALQRFECALQMSAAQADRSATARDLKNVGSALRRLGDFRGALRALTTSLQMQRAQGEVGGAVLNNIADVYRELDEPDEAIGHYRQALQAFRGQDNRVEAGHVLESLSELSLDRGDAAQAQVWLLEALQTYRQAGNRAYELRVYAGLMRAALARGDIARARQWREAAFAIADEHRLALPASLQLQIARSERLEGRPGAAVARLREAAAALPQGGVERIALLQELSLAQEAAGDRAAAIATLRDSHEQERKLSRAQQDRQLGWLRTRFETAERDRTIAALESENRLRRAELHQRTLWLWSTLASVLVAALALGLWLLRRRQHARLLQVRHEEALQRYRRETDALAEDRSLLQALLDSRQDAVCLVDAEGQLLAANRSARELLGLDPAAPLAQALGDCLADADRAALAATLERMEDAAALRLDFARSDGTALQAQLAPWERGDGLIVLSLSAGSAVAPAVEDDAEPHASDAEARGDFRRALVELMLAVVETWERSTGSGRLELAEKSRIWRVTIDDGRLRARAMERYLSLSKLPRQPRWRDVLRSAYYVLGQCAMDPAEREALQRRVDAALVYTRRRALV
ncbi:tetratricopeptide repeat protein [Lysobacter silvisoli]|uniref:PAS domain-containing protein n=1 Tax=Lysobacter silvisoli TaxID=2293254 RepID=A0A371JZG1_9GAMM|nr:tetratricopeptide repeat protein [Lysobacter silvisoli]RDZ26980.1 PAS domain-containing protein [Lysobacter silvisoli]